MESTWERHHFLVLIDIIKRMLKNTAIIARVTCSRILRVRARTWNSAIKPKPRTTYKIRLASCVVCECALSACGYVSTLRTGVRTPALHSRRTVALNKRFASTYNAVSNK